MTSPPDGEYRTQLIALEQKAQAAYDKTVLSLAGGALGVSFAFVANFVERGAMQEPRYLLAAWGAWAFSVTAALASHLTSACAIRRAIKDLDAHRPFARRYDVATAVLNAVAGVLFLVGVLSITYFVGRNIMVVSYETQVVPDQDLEKKGYRVPPPPPQEQTGSQGEAPKDEAPKGE